MTSQPAVTILVVDDNEASLYVKSRLLRRAGFVVVEAHTGNEALQLAFALQPALVLLDVNLPDISGIEVCRRIKGEPALASLFILQISASLISTEDKVRALEGGADSYLLEPVEPEELIATVRALLRLQRAEQALRESEARFRNMADHAPAMIWITDPKASCIYLNQQWYEFTGQYPEGALTAGWLAAVHLDDLPKAAQQLEQANQEHTAFRLEHRLLHQDGLYRWVINSAAPRFDSGGDFLGHIGSVFDITDRHQAEERLQLINRLSEELNYAEGAEQIDQLALVALQQILSADRVSILRCNEQREMRFRVWHGLSADYRQQVEGHSPWSADEPHPQPVLVPDANAANAELGSLQPIVLKEGIQAIAFIPLVDGEQLMGKFMLYYDQPHPFSAAEILWVQTIARYVAHAHRRKQGEAEMRQLNETLEQRVRERTAELERSNRELDQFTYVASHDLKAPLRAINHLANWIIQDSAGVLPVASQEHLVRLLGRVRRMDVLLDDLLAYSRAGRQRHTPELVQLAVLVQNIIELLAPPAGFAVTLQTMLHFINVERIPLETVLRNLIDNAVKHHHHPEQGRVEVSAQIQGQFIEFRVKDNGPGIDTTFHQRIFEMFQTLQPRDQIEGSGVGLAVVKKLVESRGGTVEVKSTLGEGTTFCFTWPEDSIIDME